MVVKGHCVTEFKKKKNLLCLVQFGFECVSELFKKREREKRKVDLIQIVRGRVCFRWLRELFQYKGDTEDGVVPQLACDSLHLHVFFSYSHRNHIQAYRGLSSSVVKDT